jgi:hypothetical protein
VRKEGKKEGKKEVKPRFLLLDFSPSLLLSSPRSPAQNPPNPVGLAFADGQFE